MSAIAADVDRQALDHGRGPRARRRRHHVRVEPGTFNVLLGPSGCGKSTTLRLIAGLETADGGRIRSAAATSRACRRPQRSISMVFQSYALFPHLTVAENIVFGLRVRKVPAAERAQRLARVAELLGLRRSSRASRRSCPAASSSAWRWAARSSPRRRCA